MLKYPNGELYEGMVLRGKPNGFGKKRFKNGLGAHAEGEYVGEWREGKRHGKGTQILQTEEMYQGDGSRPHTTWHLSLE